MMRRIRVLAESQQILSKIQPGINQSISDAFEDWLKIREFSQTLSGGVINYKARTKAGIIHDNIEKHIKDKFYGSEGILVDDFNGIFGMLVEEDLFIRFKKMDDTYSVRNVATKQTLKYQNQQELDGIPPEPTLLFAGYIPDKSWSSIKGIYLACWVGGELSWVDDQGRYTVEQLNIDLNETTDEELYKNIDKRVRLKNKKDQKNTKTGTDKN